MLKRIVCKKSIFIICCLVLFFSQIESWCVDPGVSDVHAAASENGWRSIGKGRYYYVNGKPAKGLKKIGSYTYYFSKTGVMQKNKWVQFGSYKRYFGSNGRMVKNTRIGLRSINKQGLYKNNESPCLLQLSEKLPLYGNNACLSFRSHKIQRLGCQICQGLLQPPQRELFLVFLRICVYGKGTWV